MTKLRVEYFDRSYAQMQADLNATFPGEGVRVVSVTRDRKKYIGLVNGATNPGGAYYYVDQASGEIADVGKRFPGLTPRDVSPVKFFTYAARDGLQIPAYVTVPQWLVRSQPAARGHAAWWSRGAR
jgi:dipeptidyl aminopeptidase/acylaminoacyl peptidase